MITGIESFPIQLLLVCSSLLLSYVLSIVFTKFLLKRFASWASLVPIKEELKTTQQKKSGTPALGGIPFILATTVAVILIGDLRQSYTWIPLVSCWAFGIIGIIDDIVKIKKRSSDGLKSRQKLAMQVLASALVIWLIIRYSGLRFSVLTLPWNPSQQIDIGPWYTFAALFYLLYFVNAVNITDGLDGLAAGLSLPILVMVVTIALLFGYGVHADSIQASISGGGTSLALTCCAFIGSLLAFLWYNSRPAQIFMGDGGSHSIGAVLAVSALLLKIELVVLVASGIFLVEFFSSLIQILSIRVRGKKVFSIAPLHHHYEQNGTDEGKLVSRFRIAGNLCVVIAVIFLIIKYL